MWLLSQMLTDFNSIWQYCSKKISKQMTYFFTQFVYEYHRIKQEIFYVLSLVPFCLAVKCQFLAASSSKQASKIL